LKPQVALCPGARFALNVPPGVAVTVEPVWVTTALYGVPAMIRCPPP
jgi:hypothetical protein